MMRRLLTPGALVSSLVLAAAGSLTLASPAGAVTWPAATAISPAGVEADNTQIAFGPDGTATAVWEQFGGGVSRVQVSTRPPGGSWSAPEDLSDAADGARVPQVSTGLDGTSVVVWKLDVGGEDRIQASTRAPGGGWSPALSISALGQPAEGQTVTSGPDGTATVVWRGYDGVRWRIQASSRPAGGAWSAAVDLSDPTQTADSPTVASGADGTVAVAWSRTDGTNDRVQAATRTPAGVWSSASTLSAAGANAVLPDISVTPNGGSTAVWQRLDGSDLRIQASTRPAGGAWAPALTLSDAGENARNARVAAGLDGTTTAVWQRSDGSDDRAQVSTLSPGGAWTAVETLSDAGQAADDPQVAVAPNGTAIASWKRSDGTHDRIQVSTRPTGGAWAAATTVSESGLAAYATQVGVGPDGTAALVWTQDDGSNFRSYATVVDDALPPPPKPPVVAVVPDTGAIKGKKTIKKAKAKYSFTSPTAGATFECRVDTKFRKYLGVSKKKAKKQVPWKACSSPYVVRVKKLKDGKHKLYVRSVLGGQVDPTPSVKKLKVT